MMNRYLPLLLLVMMFAKDASAQGRVEEKTFLAPSIQHNKGGEDPRRKLIVYLPPGYDEGSRRYPTLYFLHGFAVDAGDMMQWIGFKALMDSAIATGILPPAILVLPSSMTKYFGSFYTNSSLTGNWSDYIGRDVVQYMDRHYRTIPHRDSRGLFGHSMGGHGALKIGMLFADTFSAVYAMSPGALHFSDEFRLGHPAIRQLYRQKNLDSLRTAAPYYDFERFPFFEMLFVSMARTYSPDAGEQLMQARLPVRYVGDSMDVDAGVLKKWEAHFPINMIEAHLPALRSLKALKIDWGRNEAFRHIPATNLQFSKKLESLGVKHFAEEYIGDHVNMLEGFEGRIFTEVLPFFGRYLSVRGQ